MSTTKRFVSGFLFASMAIASAAHAEMVPWGGAFALQGTGGFINPGTLVYFNPQPEPPAFLQLLDPDDPTTPEITINADAGAVFTLAFAFYSGVTGQPFLYDIGGPPPNAQGDFQFIAFSDAGDLIVELNIMSSTGGVPDGSWVGFNPQPEPPAINMFGGDGQAQGFQFGMTSLSDVVLTFRVLEDANGEYIPFSQVTNPIPIPPALALLPAALGILGVTQARRTAFGDRATRTETGSERRG